MLSSNRLRRLLAAFFLFVLVELGTWLTILVWAHDVGGPGFVGVVAAVQLVIAAAAAPVLASIGDRLPRSRALSLSYLGMAGLTTVTGAALLADAHPLIVLALASLVSAAFSVGRPIHASLIPDLADEPADAVAANVVSSTLEGAGGFAGPALAGLMLVWTVPGVVFLVLMAGVALGSVLVAGMGRVSRAGALQAESDGGILAAFKLLARTRSQRYVVILGAVSAVAVGALDILAVVLAIDVLGLGDSGAGYTVSLLGLGGLLGGLVAASMVGRRLAPVLVAAAAVRGGALLVLGLQPGWVLLLVASGAGFSVVDVGVRTLLQRLTAPDVMSRTFGVLEGLGLAGLAVGSLAAAGLVATVGVQTALLGFGALLPVTVLVGYKIFASADREADVPTDVIRALGSVALFGLLAPPTLEMMARRSRIVQFETGGTIIQEGEHSRHVLAIVEGALDVEKGGRFLARLGAGDVVGEIAALHDVGRTATVTARSDVKAISIPGDAFVSAVRGETDAWSLSSSVAGRRLAEQEG